MSKLFLFFYLLLASSIYLIALPFLLVISFKKKYKKSIPARFFLYKNRIKGRPDIWFHACSLGEVKSLEPIIESLNPKLSKNILITTITETGNIEAQKLAKNLDRFNIEARYLPFEIFLYFWIPDGIKKLIVTEAELWYVLFKISKDRGAETILINGRISTKSYPKYKKLAFFYKYLFKNVDIVLAQQLGDKDRLESIGAKNVRVFGNLKLLNIPKVNRKYEKGKREILLIASSHQGEETIILEAISKLIQSGKFDFKKERILVAPDRKSVV